MVYEVVCLTVRVLPPKELKPLASSAVGLVHAASESSTARLLAKELQKIGIT